jgi:hypothetical protein
MEQPLTLGDVVTILSFLAELAENPITKLRLR